MDAPGIGQLIKKLTTQKTQNIKKSSISSILSIIIIIIIIIIMIIIIIIIIIIIMVILVVLSIWVCSLRRLHTMWERTLNYTQVSLKIKNLEDLFTIIRSSQ